MVIAMLCTFLALEDEEANCITAEEKRLFIDNRQRQEALAMSLAECFGISFKNMEIGATIIGKYGATTHIVHYGMCSDCVHQN